jgi:3-methyl-2-oxobutanoate hydroxymethyltransferase
VSAGTRARFLELAALKGKAPIVMLTAYDAPGAAAAAEGGVDVLLVGDSAATVVLGYSSTREISLDELLVLTRAVRRGAPGLPVVGDMPWGTYEESDTVAVRTAQRFVEEAGCDAVKLEGAGSILPRVRAIVEAGIPVVGHVGLLPQAARTEADFRARGRSAEEAVRIVRDGEALAAVGITLLVAEAMPPPVGAELAARVAVPVIGIGAGAGVDGQVLVFHDLLGLTSGHVPRFVRRYATLREQSVEAIRSWSADVRAGLFPEPAESYGMATDEAARFGALLGSTLPEPAEPTDQADGAAG